MRTILLLEDDKNLNRGISLKLEKEGYEVYSAVTIAQAREMFQTETIDMVISDITLPDGSGLDFGKFVRDNGNAYLVYLTALDQEVDIVNGYDTGADDYVTKPFSLMVLTSKVNALMRRLSDTGRKALVSGDISVSLEQMTVMKAGSQVMLSKTEIMLLIYLMRNAGQIVSREQILDSVWGLDGRFVDDNTVAVNISRLKTKLATDHIVNARGLGYIWTGKITDQS